MYQALSEGFDLPHGLALDVLPLDYYPKNPAERKKQVRWALIYSLFCAQTIPEKAWCGHEMGKSHLTRPDSKISTLSHLEKAEKK